MYATVMINEKDTTEWGWYGMDSSDGKNRTVGGKKENREINVIPFQLKYS